jgi:hypothetical protein
MYVCSYAIAINHIAVGAKHKKNRHLVDAAAKLAVM